MKELGNYGRVAPRVVLLSLEGRCLEDLRDLASGALAMAHWPVNTMDQHVCTLTERHCVHSWLTFCKQFRRLVFERYVSKTPGRVSAAVPELFYKKGRGSPRRLTGTHTRRHNNNTTLCTVPSKVSHTAPLERHTMRLSTLLPLVAMVAAMDMDMDNNNDMMSHHDDSEHRGLPATAGIANGSDIVPIPHEMKHQHGAPILETALTPAEYAYWSHYNTTTFFTIDSPNKNALWIHVATLVVAAVFLYPICLVLNSVKSKWYIPSLTVYAVTVVASLASLKVFGSSAPDLYLHNAYSTMSWILLVATIVHYCTAVLHCSTKWISGEWILNQTPELNQPFIPLEDLDLEAQSAHSVSPAPSTLIDSDSNGKKNSDPPTQPHSPDTPATAVFKDSLDMGEDFYTPPVGKSHSSLARDGILSSVFLHPRIQSIAETFEPSIMIVFNLINMPMLAYLFIYFMTGVATANLLGQGTRVFNLLAHFIKGGVFFILGVFSLARYCGCLSSSGFAWNKCIIFKNQVNHQSFWYRWVPHGMFTMEFYESFLIFFYGSTNVFLEHLAGSGGAWNAKDLQHVSIAFMYIGAGLCGLITEKILSDWRFNQVLSNTNINPAAIHAGSPGYSPNPFPLFTIFWTGILMSQHKQSSETSTVIHEQWGYLLSAGSFFRMATFILLMLVPNKNLAPSRPFTELITSFCLLAGGAIFMQSTDQVVEALEYRGLTSMFTLNMNVGCITLLMGWEMVLLIWKDRMQRN